MGKQNEDVADNLETMLGLKEEETNSGASEENKTTENKDETNPQQTTTDTNSNQTIDFSKEQQDIVKEIARIDVKLEALETSSVNVEDFYENLEEHLTSDEQQLEFDDKKAYLKIVAQKEKEYIAKNSKEDDKKALNDKKAALSAIVERQNAIANTVKKYPEYNHEKVQDFFENDLSQREKDTIFKEAKSYQDVYELSYKKYIEKNPSNIVSQKGTQIPNLNNVRKTEVSNGVLKDGFKSADEELMEALGLK